MNFFLKNYYTNAEKYVKIARNYFRKRGTLMLTIIDYGAGNLRSVQKACEAVGTRAHITSDPKEILSADHVILPGVGAFGDCMKSLSDNHMIATIHEVIRQGTPFLGICLGMQMLFEESHEFGVHRGLGLLKGKILPIAPKIPESYKIPHIGWNPLSIKKASPLFKHIKDGDAVYFVHSYYAECQKDDLLASSEYGAELTAAVASGNVYGCQFHPEKSGEVGLNILKGFSEL